MMSLSGNNIELVLSYFLKSLSKAYWLHYINTRKGVCLLTLSSNFKKLKYNTAAFTAFYQKLAIQSGNYS